MRTFAAGILIGMGLVASPAAWAADAPAGSDDALWHWLWQRQGWSRPLTATPSPSPARQALEVLAAGNVSRARELLKQATVTPVPVEALLVGALIEATASDKAKAIALARQAIRREPRSAVARLVMAEINGGTEAASANLPQWLIAAGAAPEQPLTLVKLGEALWVLGDQSSARKAFDAARAQAGRDALPGAAIGSFFLRQRQTDDAINAFRAAWELKPDDLVLLQTLENLYLDADRPQSAIELYQVAVRRHPESWQLQYRLANLTGRHAPDKLLGVLEPAARRFAGSATILVQIGALATEGKQYGFAEQVYQRALQREPNQVAAYTGLANLLLQTGRSEQAEGILQRAVQQAPDFAEGHHLLGVLALQRQDAPGALRHLEEAHRLAPQAAPTSMALALAYRLAQLPERSIALLKDEAQRSPRRAEVWLSLGDAYLDHKDYGQAAASYQKATELQPLDVDGFYALGNAYSQANKTDQAIKAYNRAILLEPRHLDARNNLANLYLRSKQLDVAIDQLERLLTIEPGYATGYYNLACAYALQHEADQAFKLLDRAIMLDAKLKDVARNDSDFDAVRDDSRFLKLVGEPVPGRPSADGKPASP